MKAVGVVLHQVNKDKVKIIFLFSSFVYSFSTHLYLIEGLYSIYIEIIRAWGYDYK